MRLFRWLEHAVPIAFAALAATLLALTSLWAWRWYREPFIGALLEPNNVVSKIGRQAWPARQAGVRWPERLVAVNDVSVTDSRQAQALINAGAGQPLRLTFEQSDGTRRTVTLTAIRPGLDDLISLFLIPWLVGLVFLVTAIWAYRIRPDLHASRAFLVFGASVSVLTSAFLDMNTTHYVVLLWALSLSATAAATIHIALVFPRYLPLVERHPYLRYAGWLPMLLLSVPTVLALLRPPDPLHYITTWIWNYAFIALAMIFLIITLSTRVLISRSPMVRQQSRVIVFGAALAFIPILLLYLLPIAFGGQIPEFHTTLYFPPLVFLPLAVTYAIVRYRLLDVDRLLSRALTYLLTTAAALGAFYLLIAVISFVVQQTVQPDQPLIIAAYLLLLVFLLMPLRDLIQRAIDRLFYRAPADYRRVLTSLAATLVVTPDLSRTLRLLEEHLQQALSPERIVVYLFDDDQQAYVPHASGPDEWPVLPVSDALVRLIHQNPTPLWLPPGRELPLLLQQERAAYDRLGCPTFVPLRYEGKLIGFLALGQRRSGDPYSGDDLDFLAAVAGQSALALENARLFANLRRTLDQTLEMKNLMDDIFASIATGVITTDLQRQITLFNRAAERILGIPVQRVLGRPLDQALPALGPELQSAADGALQHGAITLSNEINTRLPGRGELTLRLSCSPLRDAHLGTKGATIVFEDLTERRQLMAEQERIRQTFGRVVAPRVRDRLLSDPSNLQLDGVQQQVTILFADLAGFTSYSERIEAATVFRVLNTYLDLAAQAILEQEGTLDKFMGDAVLALWNAPDPQQDHALRAVRAARDILQRARDAHRRFPQAEHHLEFRIGITTGAAIVGNVGTAQLFNYTAIGDTVNLAQRLQDAASPGQVLMSRATYESVRSQVDAEALQPLVVPGRNQPVQVYRFLGFRDGTG